MRITRSACVFISTLVLAWIATIEPAAAEIRRAQPELAWHQNMACASSADFASPGEAFNALSAGCGTYCMVWETYVQDNPGAYQAFATIYQTCNPPISRSDPAYGPFALITATPSCQTANGWWLGSPQTGFPVGVCYIWVNKTDHSKKPCKDCFGNPIQPATGNKRQVEVDYRGSGKFPLTLERIYNSGPQFDRTWTHNFAYRITDDSGAGQEVATLHRPEGDFSFAHVGSDWVSDSDVNLRLSGGNGGFTVTTEDGLRREVYNTYNYVAYIADSSAAVQYNFTYNLITGGPDQYYLLTQVVNAFGHALSFSYDAQHQYRLDTVTTPSGAITYGYDGIGNLATATYPDSSVRTYRYNEPTFTSGSDLPNHLTGVIDESSSRYSNFGYDANGLAILTEHAGGADRVTASYATPPAAVCSRTYLPSNGLMFEDCVNTAPSGVSITDALGTSRTYGFAAINGDVRTTGVPTPCNKNCPQTPMSRLFDANGNETSSRDFNGTLTCREFDASRNLETVRVEGFASTVPSCPANLASYTPQAGTRERKIVTAWHSTFRIPTTIVEANRTTSLTHDANGNVLTRTVTDTSVIPNVSRTWTYTYNSYGQILTDDGPRTDVTDVTTYTYYACTTGYQCGQVNTITNAAGHVTTYNSYNAHGQATQITDPNGLVTTLGYDARQRLADRCSGGTLPTCTGGELTHLDYWPTSLLKRVTNPDASYIEYTYDAAHRLTQIQDGALNKIVYTLDAMGNRTAENSYDPSNALKRTHSRVINSLNQLWKDVNAAGTANVTTVFGYDNNGNQTTTNAPLSRNSTNIYDELNRLKQITDPNSGVTLFGYDANDNLTWVTDPRTLVTSYTYTGFGDLKTQTSPDTGLTTNTYDSGGNLQTSTDARSTVKAYTYDSMNRVLTAAYKIGATADQTFTYAYDVGTNGKGHLTGAADSKFELAWTYDAKGRVIGKAQKEMPSNITQSIGYGYNAQGQLATIAYTSGKIIQYGYNTNGQVTSITLLGSPNVTILSNIAYDPFGPVKGWTWGNGNAASRVFDTDGKLTNINHSSTVVGNRTLGYDDAFRITSATDSAGGPSWTLGYDILDRLNSATGPTTIGYTYDANGNRLTQTGAGASTYTVSSTSNRLSSTTGGLVRTYSYDNAGSVLQSGATTHTYYNSGRMKTAKIGAASATTYYYNALGQRVKKIGGGATTTFFVYDEAGHLNGEYSSTGSVVQEFVWLGDIPVATLRSGSIYYIHTDQLNTPRKVSNSTPTPQLKWKWDPSPFGDGGTLNENPSGAGIFKFNLRFPGQYFDSESNLNYNYFRDYDPAIGRYDESDPIGLKGGLNTYAYVRSTPLKLADRDGRVAGVLVIPAVTDIAINIGAAAVAAMGYNVSCSKKDPETCREHLVACLESGWGGTVSHSTACLACFDRCKGNGGKWPDSIVSGEFGELTIYCDYWMKRFFEYRHN